MERFFNIIKHFLASADSGGTGRKPSAPGPEHDQAWDEETPDKAASFARRSRWRTLRSRTNG